MCNFSSFIKADFCCSAIASMARIRNFKMFAISVLNNRWCYSRQVNWVVNVDIHSLHLVVITSLQAFPMASKVFTIVILLLLAEFGNHTHIVDNCQIDAKLETLAQIDKESSTAKKNGSKKSLWWPKRLLIWYFPSVARRWKISCHVSVSRNHSICNSLVNGPYWLVMQFTIIRIFQWKSPVGINSKWE